MLTFKVLWRRGGKGSKRDRCERRVMLKKRGPMREAHWTSKHRFLLTFDTINSSVLISWESFSYVGSSVTLLTRLLISARMWLLFSLLFFVLVFLYNMLAHSTHKKYIFYMHEKKLNKCFIMLIYCLSKFFLQFCEMTPTCFTHWIWKWPVIREDLWCSHYLVASLLSTTKQLFCQQIFF